ncbi:MAG TPA: protein kinase [Planctomycetota bacterium]|nr:protein kinase [Planctomycetota bacterium]
MDPLDAYLDACLAGEAEEPDVFLARHPELDEEARTVIRTIHREAARRRKRDALPFPRLGEYVLLRRLGEGGMGQVFLARQESLDRDVALKILRPELQSSQGAATRFRREALAVAKLRHRNIVAVHAMGEENGVRYIAMELVPGRNLDDVLAEGAARGDPPALDRILSWASQIARALAHAHEQGIVHRDVKPSNIRISPDGRPLLLDFGLARDLAADATALTTTFAGSPLYAAPEQLAGADIDARADLYALGVTLYQGVTGRVPFPGRTFEQVLKRVLVEDPLPPRRLDPTLPRALDVVVLKALAKSPADRYATASELADDLDAVREGRPIRARPPSPIARLRASARRRPRLTAGILLALATVGVAVGGSLWRDAADRTRRRGEAAADVREARARIRRLREIRTASEADARRLDGLREALTGRHFAPEEDKDLDVLELREATYVREREAVFGEALDLLRAAEKLDPGIAGTDDVRAELYGERWKEALATRDGIAESFYRQQALAYDASGRLAREMTGAAEVDLATGGEPASVYVFRYVEESELRDGGERRLVAVGYPAAAPGLDPAAWALRVVAPAGDVTATDVIVRVAGAPVRGSVFVPARRARLLAIAGVPVADLYDARARGGPGDEREFELEIDGRSEVVRATSLGGVGAVTDAAGMVESGGALGAVVHDGTVREVLLPHGLEVRMTAAPLYPHGGCHAGRTPLHLSLPPGLYLLLLTREGRRPVRRDLDAASGTRLHYDLPLPQEDMPPEFAYVVGLLGEVEPFWMLDREVTIAEYLEFLNDPAVLPTVGTDAGPILPMTGFDDGRGCPRDAAGRFLVPASMEPGWPAMTVPRGDAQAYAAWRTRRARARGATWRFALPTFAEWLIAGGRGRYFPFGNHYRPKWMKSCFARPRACIEAVRSYPVDESPGGIFDMSGSMYEWLDDWYDEVAGRRRLAGGAWGEGGPPELFRLSGGTGASPTYVSSMVGFRVTLRAAGGP